MTSEVRAWPPHAAEVSGIDPQYAAGLAGLAGFDYAWLLMWLHRPRDAGRALRLLHVPFLLRAQQRQIGIFATRGPRRVNPIGLSLIRLSSAATQVRFTGVGLIDGSTPGGLGPACEPSC